MRAIVYSRVSTDAQERDGSSLDTQERASCASVATTTMLARGPIKHRPAPATPVRSNPTVTLSDPGVGVGV